MLQIGFGGLAAFFVMKVLTSIALLRHLPLLSLVLMLALAPHTGFAAQPVPNDHALFPIAVGSQYGGINRTGEVVIPAEYDEPIALREGLARVRKGTRVAYRDISGKPVIALQERASELFSRGMAPASGADAHGVMRYGYLNRSGEWAIEPRFADAKAFSENRAVVGVPDESGRVARRHVCRQAVRCRVARAGMMGIAK